MDIGQLLVSVQLCTGDGMDVFYLRGERRVVHLSSREGQLFLYLFSARLKKLIAPISLEFKQSAKGCQALFGYLNNGLR